MPLVQGFPASGGGGSIPLPIVLPFTPDFYVAPTNLGGSPAGNGSIGSPWDLQTALNQPAALVPGKKVAMRGGAYSGNYISNTNGTPTAPVIFRQYPGERATIVTPVRGLEIHGSYTWFWGFEISGPSSSDGVSNQGIQSKCIHLIIHDAAATGIGSGITNFTGNNPRGGEFYGCIVYNNGSQNFDHGIYAQNDDAFGTLFILENIIFNNWSLGLHCFIQPGELANGIDAEGNVIFNDSSTGLAFRNNEVLFGGNAPATRDTFRSNYVYRNSQTGSPLYSNLASVDLGSSQSNNGNGTMTCRDNYIVGGLSLANWVTAMVTGNIQYNYNGQLVNNIGSLAGHIYNSDVYYGDPAAAAFLYDGNLATTLTSWKTQTGLVNPGSYAGLTPPNAIFVRPSNYEAGRANIIAFNWAGLPTITVDLSGVLIPGQSFVILNAQDFFGSPIVSGIYQGGTVDIPMTAVPAPIPIGRGHAGPVTGPTFQVFVVRLQGA